MPINIFAEQAAALDSGGAPALLIPYNQLPELVVSTLVFSIIGIIIFAIAFWIMQRMTPFSIRKEIEEDHNTALALVIASVIIGIALIISAAVHG